MAVVGSGGSAEIQMNLKNLGVDPDDWSRLEATIISYKRVHSVKIDDSTGNMVVKPNLEGIPPHKHSGEIDALYKSLKETVHHRATKPIRLHTSPQRR